MEGKEEDVRLGANKFSERQPIGTAAQGTDDKDYKEPPPAPLFEPGELKSWSFYRAGIAEFVATFLFLYISILTVMGVSKSQSKCATVGIQGIAWSFGGMIFALVYCTAGISGGHINPAVTFGLFLARKLSLTRAIFYMVMQCLGAICGAGVVKGFQQGLATASALRSSAPSSSSTPSSPPPTPRGTPGTPTSRSLLPSQLGSPCSWSTWPPSPSPAPASTRQGALALPSSTTGTMPGMTTGSSGSAPSSAPPWRPSTTR
ncbi:hypothetical protein PVAP13_7NG282100 [Panicum virgatum]|uniref:Uncharacterized protein n=1 Tax=Panicum virgatum TaxID=38727 RepID=A0A8T0Q5V0_PANVG|nr:hypothetical protein PVAP13_7NG282100 [Panicum virgatum]